MTIDETTNRIGTLDLEDLDTATEVIAARGRAVVQFAAGADRQSLRAARAAGQLLIDQLLDERRRLLTEIRNAHSLHDSLVSNVSDDYHPTSLLGSSLMA